MHDTASKLYNGFLRIYFNECYDLSDPKRSKMDSKYISTNLAFEDYNYDEWFTEESDYSTVKGDEKRVRCFSTLRR